MRWFLLLVGVFVVHSSTLLISPPLWQDEVQILESGRLTFWEAQRDWSILWSAEKNRPFLLWSYLGPGLQEAAYQIAGHSPIGPRLASLLGGIAASSVALGWLLARGVPGPAAWLLGAIFLLDPLPVEGYRGARIDCWVLALCFGACWLLRAGSRDANRTRVTPRTMAAGGLAAAAFFVWPSAVLVYPLVLVELAGLSRSVLVQQGRWTGALHSVAAFAVGGVAASIIALLPIMPLLEMIWSDISDIVAVNQPAPHPVIHARDLLVSFKYSPLLPLVALVGLGFRANWQLAGVTTAVLFYILSTRCYAGRVVYLLPYLLAILGGAYLALEQARFRRSGTLVLSVLFLWSAGLSLVARPSVAMMHREERSIESLFQAARRSIGPGPHRVYVGAWPLYYPGRSLGWWMFQSYTENAHEVQTLLSTVDYAVFLATDVGPSLSAQLSQGGLQPRERLMDLRDDSGAHRLPQGVTAARGYGPYVVYARSGAARASRPSLE